MASRSIRLLLLAVVIELFALVVGGGPLALGLFGLGRLVAFVIAVIGLVVAIVGVTSRE